MRVALTRGPSYMQRWLRGYLLDALGRLDGPAAQPKTVAGFVDEVVGAEPTRRPSAGLGEDLRLQSGSAIGSGLELNAELLQLSAFSRQRSAAQARSHRATELVARMDVRDQDAAELLRALIEEGRLLREQSTALLEAIVRKLDSIERTQYS